MPRVEFRHRGDPVLDHATGRFFATQPIPTNRETPTVTPATGNRIEEAARRLDNETLNRVWATVENESIAVDNMTMGERLQRVTQGIGLPGPATTAINLGQLPQETFDIETPF